ncbi:MAG TPA: YciI family protein [Polyangiaceae bacterium]|nr:YciI family protein [Polyangiaceae bacterium]
MRFIVMHKVDAKMEGGGSPSQEIISQMGALVQASLREGVFLNGAGLHRSARRVRLGAATGEAPRTDGPYSGSNELVSSFTMLSTKSLDHAVAHARTLAKELGGVEVEIGPVVEPWDLGLMPAPEHAPKRFLLLTKATADDEAGGGTAAKHTAAVTALAASFQGDAAVIAAESLAPSSKGARLPAPGKAGKRVWVDGPFAESKELIAGFSLLSLPSKADALKWADRYADILVDAEVDVREVNEP